MAVMAGAVLLSVGTAAAVELTPEADTYIQENTPDSNLSHEHNMIAWDWWNPGPEEWLWYKMYIQFDVSSLTLPLTTDAKLTCTTRDGQFPPGTTLWGLNDGDPGEAWIEADLTWNNAPANDTAGNGFLSNATLLGEFHNIQQGVAGGTGDFCGDALDNFLNADTDGLATFMVLSPGETLDPPNNGFVYFVTKESSTLAPPTLNDDATCIVVIEGDLNEDGFVGQADLDIVLAMWGNGPIIPDPRADVNEDDFVGQTDLDYVLAAWGQGTPPEAPVPEPATLSLIGLGALSLLRRRRG